MHAILLFSFLTTTMAMPSVPRPHFEQSLNTRDSVNINSDLVFSPVARTPSPRTSKRVSFTTGGQVEYCGESDPTESFGEEAPLQADCDAIGRSAAEGTPGFYTLRPEDFDPATGWCKIATKGTCSFAVRFQVASQRQTAWIGTQDVHFYIQRYVLDAKDGRIGAVGTMACYNGTPGKIIYLEWGLIRP